MTEYKSENRDYTVEEYPPAWVEKFEVLKNLVVSIFGDKTLHIEHVGSLPLLG
ncbi:MAG: GrpB protein [Patescibacteria group bacterium]|nr:GrpB protein [Patescibacteria group bacterium]